MNNIRWSLVGVLLSTLIFDMWLSYLGLVKLFDGEFFSAFLYLMAAFLVFNTLWSYLTEKE